jgi:hypothetical protein
MVRPVSLDAHEFVAKLSLDALTGHHDRALEHLLTSHARRGKGSASTFRERPAWSSPTTLAPTKDWSRSATEAVVLVQNVVNLSLDGSFGAASLWTPESKSKTRKTEATRRRHPATVSTCQ